MATGIVKRSGQNSALRFLYSSGIAILLPPNEAAIASEKPAYSTRLAVPFIAATPSTSSGCNAVNVRLAVPSIEPPQRNTRATRPVLFNSPMI